MAGSKGLEASTLQSALNSGGPVNKKTHKFHENAKKQVFSLVIYGLKFVPVLWIFGETAQETWNCMNGA